MLQVTRMSVRFRWWGLLVTLFLLNGCGKPAGNASEAATIALITTLGGKVEQDDKDPLRPVLKVYLHSSKVQDADLAALQKLPRMQNLFLGRTAIGDKGLEFLKDATQLKTLSLNGTRVTDEGLRHLSGLTALKTLNLQETKVTATGIAALKQVLTSTTIAR